MTDRPTARSPLERWGIAVARRRFLVLALWTLVLGGAAVLYSMLPARLVAPDYSVSGSESAQAQQLLGERFPALGGEQDVVVFRSDHYLADTRQYREVVDRTLADVRRLPDVGTVIGPYDTTAGDQISADRRVAVALVGLRGAAATHPATVRTVADRLSEQARGSPVEAYLTGTSPLNNDLSEIELRDQERAEGIGIPVALAVLLLALGSAVSAALPVAVALASVLTCLGALTPLAGPLNLDQFVTVITSMIGLGVGIDYSLFVVSRFREELAKRARPTRDDIAKAVGTALHTSGHTIVVSGLIVIVALASMVVINGHIFREIAIAASMVVSCCLLAGLTLLPAVLAALGDRVNSMALPRRWRRPAAADGADSRWATWALFVLKRPLRLGLPALAVLAALALPIAGIRLGLDQGLSALADTPAGRGAQTVAASFSPGSVSPVQLVGCTTGGALSTADLDGVARLSAAVRADHRVAQTTSVTDLLDQRFGGHSADTLRAALANPASQPVLSRMVDPPTRCVQLTVVPDVAVDSPVASSLVTDLRQNVVPSALGGLDLRMHVGGLTAQNVDLAAETTGKLPVVIAIVLALSFCYLVVVFRSLWLPLKAVALNLLATAAALGLTVFVFQQGHGAGVLDFTSVGTLQAYLPVALFTLLFGVSMDYEVFLVRRVQEEWLTGGDNARAVAVGLQHTARQITSGAAIMVVVFGSFLAADVLELKQFGFGLAVAVLIDSTIVRMLLVPAGMGVASNANWWLPRTLTRLLPASRRAE